MSELDDLIEEQQKDMRSYRMYPEQGVAVPFEDGMVHEMKAPMKAPPSTRYGCGKHGTEHWYVTPKGYGYCRPCRARYARAYRERFKAYVEGA